MRRSWKRIVMVLHCVWILGGQGFAMAAPCEPRNPIFGWVPHEEEYVLVTEQAGKYDYIHMPSVRKIDEGNHVCYYAEGLQWVEGERQEDNQCIPTDWAFDWYPGGENYTIGFLQRGPWRFLYCRMKKSIGSSMKKGRMYMIWYTKAAFMTFSRKSIGS